MDATKWVLPKDITIRVVNKTTGKVKNVFPNIANNKQLMKTSGQQIADPQYDAKMYAVKNNRPFIENGKSKEPVKESFAPIDEPKACCVVTDDIKFGDPLGKVQECCDDSNEPSTNYGVCGATLNPSGEQLISNEKPKRTRRTKEQMKQSKL